MSDVNSYDANQLAERVAKSYKANDMKSALSLCQQLNHRFDGFHHGWYLASFLMSRVNNNKDALLAIEKAISLYSSDKYLLQKAQCHIALGDIPGAKSVCGGLMK